MKSANTLWMWDDDIPNNDIDENMYVNWQDYSVWYKGQQIGYMKSDASCIEPFYEKVYDNLKSSKEKEKFKEVAPTAEFTPPTSSLLDTESEVEAMLKSVEDYCRVEVLSDCRFGEIDRRKRRMKDKIKYWLSILWIISETIVDILYFW